MKTAILELKVPWGVSPFDEELLNLCREIADNTAPIRVECESGGVAAEKIQAEAEKMRTKAFKEFGRLFKERYPWGDFGLAVEYAHFWVDSRWE